MTPKRKNTATRELCKLDDTGLVTEPTSKGWGQNNMNFKANWLIIGQINRLKTNNWANRANKGQ